MRGKHYGVDYRWFDRFIGHHAAAPEAKADPEQVKELLYDRGLDAREGPTLSEASLGSVGEASDVHGVASSSMPSGLKEPSMSRSAIEARLGVGSRVAGGGRFAPGSLKAAIYGNAMPAQTPVAEAALSSQASSPMPSASSQTSLSAQDFSSAQASLSAQDFSSAQTPAVTARVSRLAGLIQTSINARELSAYSFEELLGAFSAAHVNPAAGAKLVQAWAFSKQLSPEQLVAALRRAKDEWVAHANQRPGVPQHLQPSIEAWDRDMATAEMLGQRHHVGQDAEDTDRERLVRVRQLLASFSGPAKPGATSADKAAAAALAAANSGAFF